MAKPKIRFNGYQDDWEQRKVKDISDFIDGNYGEKYPRDDEFIDSGIPFFTSAVTGSEGIFNENNVKFISTEKNRELTKAQSQGGDLILTNRGASMGVIAEIPEKYGLVNIGPQLTRIRGKEKEANNKYLLCLFQTSANNKKLTSMNAGSAMPFIGLKGLGNIDLLIPQYDEQLKIGEYFSCLDNLITLHQRKCDETKKLKKYMLQKMFPQNGKSVPEIRFSEFTDDWEQRKLGNILISLQNNTLSRADLSHEAGVAKNVHYGDVLIKFGEVLDVSKEKLPMILDESVLSKYKASFLQNGDVIVADTAEDSTVGKCSEIAGLNDEVVLSGLHTIPYRPIEEFASGYLGYYLNSSAYHNQLIPLMQGIKVTSISKSAMQDTDIVYPKSVEEQGKIGNYFQSLDHLITLHQRKCDELQNIKKYMLQNMFI